MSGGIHALRGFDYQATVILDLLFEHFRERGASGRVRPEGLDDVDLIWMDGADEMRTYVQIKKSSEDLDGNRTLSIWSLSAVAAELLPQTLTRLRGNVFEQRWIVGDEVGPEVSRLVKAGALAPIAAPLTYYEAVHLLARDEARIKKRWSVPDNLPPEPADAFAWTIDEFSRVAKEAGIDDQSIATYRAAAARAHADLPDALKRIHVSSTFGTEEEVRNRVLARLESCYQLRRAVVEGTLFRNLRGFINDISKRRGRAFDHEEFELEVRSVWPVMTPIRMPPPLDRDHVYRADLVDRIVVPWVGKAIEVVGISGSGKTSLAAEAFERLGGGASDSSVYYAAVHDDATFRDVLVGVAFHLRREGVTVPFGVAVRAGVTDEQTIADMAGALSTLDRPRLLLLDLVQGTCSPAFAKEIAAFLRVATSTDFQLVVFAQESALRELTPFERREHGVEHLDARGFGFEEFVILVEHFHSAPDRTLLWDVWDRMTANRSAGLLAKLARTLACSDSLAKMQESAAIPPEDVISLAERQRFARLSEAARPAAEKLLCLSLPFRRSDAEQLFSSENVGLALRELRDLGLLRAHDEEHFEMHETVRAGLEGSIALDVRHQAHQAIAEWYRKHGLITAEILHLDAAGKADEAHQRARDVFLEGQHWNALASYVAKHRLISSQELVERLLREEKVEGDYLLPEILGRVSDGSTADDLIGRVRMQQERFDKDYHWAWRMVEAILACDGTKLYDLVLFALERQQGADGSYPRMASVRLGARRSNVRIDARMLELFDKERADVKVHLAGLLLLDRQRQVMRRVFDFVQSVDEPLNWRKAGDVMSSDLPLRLDRPEDVAEFLAALPLADLPQMLVSGTAALGPFEGIVWSWRWILQSQCLGILCAVGQDEVVLENAIRVLLFLGEGTLISLCKPFGSSTSRLGLLARLVPALLPFTVDAREYEGRLLDSRLKVDDRMADLTILSAIPGAKLGELLIKLREQEPQHARLWTFLFLTMAIRHPFAAAARFIEEELASCAEPESSILAPLLFKLVELPDQEVTEVIVRALSYPWPRVRFMACMALAQCRTRLALPALVAMAKRENDASILQQAMIAAIASGPTSVGELDPFWTGQPHTEVWRYILAGRLRDKNEAQNLVDASTDPTRHWQIRRAAILAAGRLPYEDALAKIAGPVLAERSPFRIDQNHALLAHMAVSAVTLEVSTGMLPFFRAGRARFVEELAGVFDGFWRESMARDDGLPSGADVAAWLFDRLTYHGWPSAAGAPDCVIDELHIPILQAAVLTLLLDLPLAADGSEREGSARRCARTDGVATTGAVA